MKRKIVKGVKKIGGNYRGGNEGGIRGVGGVKCRGGRSWCL